MKTLKLFIIGILLTLASGMNAQVSVNVNVGAPPLWGPAGYADVRFYYLPDIEAYYDVPSAMFIFNEGGAWVHRASLPAVYAHYDLYGGYKVVLNDYRGETPYVYFKDHRGKYPKGYHKGEQKTYGERPGKGNSYEHREAKEHQNEKHAEDGNKNEQHGNDKHEQHGGGGGGKEHGNGGGHGHGK